MTQRMPSWIPEWSMTQRMPSWIPCGHLTDVIRGGYGGVAEHSLQMDIRLQTYTFTVTSMTGLGVDKCIFSERKGHMQIIKEYTVTCAQSVFPSAGDINTGV